MVGGIVSALQVFDVYCAITVLVELLEGKDHHVLPLLVHVTHNGAQEFVIVDLAVSVSVEHREGLPDAAIVQVDSVVLHGFLELIHVQGLRVVVVHDLEDALDSVDSPGSSCNDLFSYQLYVGVNIAASWLALASFGRRILIGWLLLALGLNLAPSALRASRWHPRIDLLSILLSLKLLSNLVLHGSFVSLSKNRSMHIIFPLFFAIFSVDIGH